MSLQFPQSQFNRSSSQRGLIVDSFAGGGGASLGIEWALGYGPDIAINHDRFAILMHMTNHPNCLHLTENVWKVNMDDYNDGRVVDLLWASPDCTHFSKARGGKPTKKEIRMLAWSVVKFVRDLKRNKPRVICLENVQEFLTWEDFEAWKAELRRHGYKIDYWKLKACDYGAPTIRERLYMVMRCDGLPIVKPTPTHAAPGSPEALSGKLPIYKTAASHVIDFTLPCPSIFATRKEIKEQYGLRSQRPLAPNSMRRIFLGVDKYVVNAKNPYFVSYGQHGGANRSAFDPMHTITASNKDTNQIVMPYMAPQYGQSIGSSVNRPVGALTAGGGGKQAVVAAFMAQHNTGVIGRPIDAPLSTVTTTGSQQALVSSHMMSLRNNDRRDYPVDTPVHTISAGGTHEAEVRAFMIKYYGTGIGQSLNEPAHSLTTRDRFGLVTVTYRGQPYVIVDIGMRMLSQREQFRAQGFPDDYEIENMIDGTKLTKTQQTEKCGNSVSPWMAKAVVGANCGHLVQMKEAA